MTAPEVASCGSVTVNHDGREWEVSYERGGPGGPCWRLTTWCAEPFHGEWLETLNVYGCGERVDPIGCAVEWVERLAAAGHNPEGW
jgi:hypothetical protein